MENQLYQQSLSQSAFIKLYNFPQKQKVVFLGDQAVGKTAILNQFIHGAFIEKERPTIGIDFITKQITVDDKNIKLQLWLQLHLLVKCFMSRDTAGQERFKSLIPSYVKDCNVAVIVYDISKSQSFFNLKNWYDLVKEQKGDDALVFIVGNKIDLQDKIQIAKVEAQQWADQYHAQFYEVSAKTGENIENLFYQIAKCAKKQIDTTIQQNYQNIIPQELKNDSKWDNQDNQEQNQQQKQINIQNNTNIQQSQQIQQMSIQLQVNKSIKLHKPEENRKQQQASQKGEKNEGGGCCQSVFG